MYKGNRSDGYNDEYRIHPLKIETLEFFLSASPPPFRA
jgi:hypothetical protein